MRNAELTQWALYFNHYSNDLTKATLGEKMS
jgi:hypothetical protein